MLFLEVVDDGWAAYVCRNQSANPELTEAMEEELGVTMHEILGYGNDYERAKREQLEHARYILTTKFAALCNMAKYKRWLERIGKGGIFFRLSPIMTSLESCPLRAGSSRCPDNSTRKAFQKNSESVASVASDITLAQVIQEQRAYNMERGGSIRCKDCESNGIPFTHSYFSLLQINPHNPTAEDLLTEHSVMNF